MSCAACVARVEQAVSRVEGVQHVQVNLLMRSLVLEADAARVPAILDAVSAAGYCAVPEAGEPTAAADAAERSRGAEALAVRRRWLVSLLFLLPLVLIDHLAQGQAATALCWGLLLPILWINRVFFVRGWRGLSTGAPNMDTLVAMGAAAAIAYSAADLLLLHAGHSYGESAAMILTLVSFGKWLEARATGQTGSALRALRAMLPDQATLLRDGAWCVVPAAALRAGDRLLVKPGERVPTDAVVTEGESCIDESALTGESLPVLKTVGCRVHAGTLNGNGALTLRAEKARAESALVGVIRMVGEAAAEKAPIARLADRVSSVFVPLVLLLAVLTTAAWLLSGASIGTALGFGIAVLVISCPCALGLATPVAIMVGAGKGAEHGLLFRNGATLECARRVDVVLLDKTGTITEGHPAVTDVLPQQGDENALLALVAALETGSNHPLAEAVLRAAQERGVAVPAATSLQYRAGRGVSAVVDGARCASGNAAFMAELGIVVPSEQAERLAAQGKTPIFAARDGKLCGLLAVADPVKEGSAEAVRRLRADGRRVMMLTGDHALTARAVAERVGISEWQSEALPQDKAAVVRTLQKQGHCVAVVGDGINDAPALALADVAIAIGAGTDVARAGAGMILMRSDLRDVAAALRLSRAVIRTIRQNLFWAFFYNALAIPLAAGLAMPFFGWHLTPTVAAAAMSLSSCCVVGNALRLRRLRLCPASSPAPNDMNTITIRVEGMMCPHCEKHMCDALQTLPQVSACSASHQEKRVTLSLSAPVEESVLQELVSRAGYHFAGRES